MVPAASLPSHRAAGLLPWLQRRCGKALAGVLLALVLLLPLGLSGCSGRAQPSAGVVQSALALQIQLTQEAIATALQVKPPGEAEVHHVRVEQHEAVRIGEGRGVKVVGRFDWRLPGDPERIDSPFEIFLQRGERGQSWRLARPKGGTEASAQEWITDPLPV
jgi:hypothetical protein